MRDEDHFATRTWALGHVARGIAGPFAEALAGVLKDREAECAFLLASRVRQHALLATLDAPGTRSLELLRTLFLARRSRELLKTAYGSLPRGLFGIFGRLAESSPPERGTYAGLVRVLAEGGFGAKTLLHDRFPDFHHISFYAGLPDWARCPTVTNMHSKTTASIFDAWRSASFARSYIGVGTAWYCMRKAF